MKSIIKIGVSLFVLCALSPLTFASDASKEMAVILSTLNHFPSADAKSTLMDISADKNNSAATQAIATAIHNMQHGIKGEDKTNLEGIVSGDSASAEEKALAEIALGIMHKANADALTKLEALKYYLLSFTSVPYSTLAS